MRTEDKDVQLIIPDAFDINYVEMFTSTRGYAGIQKVNQFVCSNYGYIFMIAMLINFIDLMKIILMKLLLDLRIYLNMILLI